MNRTSSFQRVASDVWDLCELQLQLLALDSQQAKRQLSRAIVALVVALFLGGSALTVAMVGGGFLLHEQTSLSVGTAIMVVAASGLAIVAILLWVSWATAKAAAKSMSQTRSEFVENMQWLKTTLISPGSTDLNSSRPDASNGRDHYPNDRNDRPSGSAVDPRSVVPLDRR